MSTAFVGRAATIAGIVPGALALALPYAAGARYADDGTTFAFLVVLLSFASWFSSEVGRDLLAAAAGAAAFGFFLFLPATAAFDRFGVLESGAWLGLCTAVVPIGAVVVWTAERKLESPPPRPARSRVGIATLLVLAGLGLAVAGVWLDVADGGPTYWNASSSGHALGILTLLLVALNVLLLAAPAGVPAVQIANLDVLVGAATIGFVEAGVVSTAFESFGSLGAGAWLEACAGVFLLAGLPRLRAAGVAPAPAPAPGPSAVSSG